ncbi:MAG TPA: response regulator [Tepidisphaeraceae bacterium]|jgi:DNA-binding response OmpR family regulator|nr:response regulator [Tepidisphaeraceae bacterium]
MKTRTRVLVVEDDRTSRAALISLLRLSGYEPIAAATLGEGFALLEKNPRFVILDLMLPDGNGSALLAHIRKNALPIRVAVTTGSMDYNAMLANSPEPPDAVFPKPLDFDGLTRWLDANEHPHG